jgi:carboxylesterase
MMAWCATIFVLLAFWGCAEPNIEAGVNLESSTVTDSSLVNPVAYLVSAADSVPNDSLRAIPVAVAFHGFSASTFEWKEFREYLDSLGSVRLSLPLLGGHGRDYEDFKKATWRDWQDEPMAEYKKLSDRGYVNLSLVCSSTGCPLLLEAFESGRFKNLVAPKQLVMVDPIVSPSSKLLTIIDIAGSVMSNVETECSEVEKANWYCNRPQEALNQLMDLLTLVRGMLENGVVAPLGTQVTLYKSIQDPSADPVSALMIYKGLRESTKTKIVVHMVESKLHVFTRLAGRESWTAIDEALQLKTFAEMDSILRQ